MKKLLLSLAFVVRVYMPDGVAYTIKDVDAVSANPNGFWVLRLTDGRTAFAPIQWSIIEEQQGGADAN